MYVLASIAATGDLGGGPLVEEGGTEIVALAKLAADGGYVWQLPISLRPTASASEAVLPSQLDLVADGNGGVWFVLSYEGFHAEFGAIKLPSRGRSKVLLAGHADGNGTALGGALLAGDWRSLNAHLASGPGGAAHVATTTVMPPAVNLFSLRGDGMVAWTTVVGTDTDARGLSYDGTSTVLMAGFSRTVDLGVTRLTASGGRDTLLARFAP